MAAKIKVIRKADSSEILNKEHNIYLGISLGNKWFTKENMREYLHWALKYTKKRVAFLVADTLHAINYEVRNNETPEKARKRAIRMGDKMISVIKELIEELPLKQQGLIDIVRWDSIDKSMEHVKMKEILYSEFKNNKEFREKILELVRTAINREKRDFTDEQLVSLARYVLEELPEILNGFTYNGTYYDLYIYPDDSLLTKFTEQLQQKEIFPYLHAKLLIKNNIFVELKV